MKKEEKQNAGASFILFLSVVSFITFGVIFVASFFDWNVSIYTDSILLIALGIFLSEQGEIFSWAEYLKDKKISQVELLHIIVGLLGITSLILGATALLGMQGKGFVGMKGIISLIAMIMILFQGILISSKSTKSKIQKNVVPRKSKKAEKIPG